MHFRTAFLLICTVLLVCCADRFVAAVGDPPPVRRISVDELASGKAVVIGRLAVPLMTTVTIRGTWHQDISFKDRDLWFHVEQVEGKPLDESIRFHRAAVSAWTDYREQTRGKVLKPRDRESWELIAHESGHFYPQPDPTVQQPTWNGGRFGTELSGVLRTPETEKYESELKERLKAEKGRR